jgi:Ca-activated chloride channel family protein
MKIDPDDPRVTAYALDELEPKEKATFEKDLQDSPEIRKEIETIRTAAKWFAAELRKEPSLELSADQRKAIEERIDRSDRSETTPFPWHRTLWWSAGITALAACLIAMLLPYAGFGPTTRSEQAPIRETARVTDGTNGYILSAQPSEKPLPTNSSRPQPPQPESLLSSPKPRAVYFPPVESKPPPPAKAPPKTLSRGENTLGNATSLGVVQERLKVNARTKSRLSDATGGDTFWGPYDGGGMGSVGDVRLPPNTGNWFDSAPPGVRQNSAEFVTEGYDSLTENEFLASKENPLSTFSIDVDTASYSNIRRFLTQGSLPPKGAVRIEEMVNYFSYAYAQPKGEDPFAVHLEVAECPWNSKHRLARIGIKGREIAPAKRPAGNFVFLIDVSGSMDCPNKLPLLRRAFKLLVEQLNEKDRIAIAVYAGSSGLVLPSTSCKDKPKILEAIDRLQAGGCTNGGEGIQLAYKIATANFIKGGVNRVILATDGDFNVGTTDQDALVRLIEEKAKSGVFLSVLGFGMGNLKDTTMVKLADKGNGNYGYIDNFNEARKLFVEQLNGTLVTIAKDVKIQVEFNPARVGAYRLVGYEKRMLKKEDFNDDKKDAGEIGAGHTITAFYEIVPAGEKIDLPGVDPLKYQRTVKPAEENASDEMLTVKLRYKQPDGDKSKLLEFPVKDDGRRYAQASEDFKFAASVATFGMILRDSKFKGNASYDAVLELADESKGVDKDGYRAEFITLVRTAKSLAGK